ncbi:MAG: TonB family protein [Opitutaceae bacterium]|jgi:colicin import membrane protein|nr:TonB family protein [Opitutaceae bacterium]
MITQAVINYAPAHRPRALGISLLFHAAIAVTAILCTLWLNNTREKTDERIIEVFPSIPIPGETRALAPDTIPAIDPIPRINPIPQPPRPIETAPTYSHYQRTTIDDHRTRHGQPHSADTKPRPQNTPLIKPRLIDTPTFPNDTIAPTQTTSGTPAGTPIQNQMDAYFAHLAQSIREAQQSPGNLNSELTVRMEFQVFADGAIGAAKVIRSSGNRAFDDSVLKAIRAVRPIGARPDGKSGSKTADFRMREEE